jgi:hypothetical protein
MKLVLWYVGQKVDDPHATPSIENAVVAAIADGDWLLFVMSPSTWRDFSADHQGSRR